MSEKILFVEDNDHLGSMLRDSLTDEGYEVNWQQDGRLAWQAFTIERFDLCILDINIPGIDGIELAKRMKKYNLLIPIVFLSARSLKSDVVMGYEIGADDYITKPFEQYQLILKVKALLARVKGTKVSQESRFKLGEVEFDSEQQVVLWDGQSHKVNRTENQILRILFSADQRIASREFIMQSVWNRSDIYTSKSLDTYMYNIRKLLKPSSLIIENVYGSGYILKKSEKNQSQ